MCEGVDMYFDYLEEECGYSPEEAEQEANLARTGEREIGGAFVGATPDGNAFVYETAQGIRAYQCVHDRWMNYKGV